MAGKNALKNQLNSRGGGYSGKVLLGMCRSPLRAPTPFLSILWPIIDPILVTFGQMCNFRDPNLVTFYFYELTHFFRLNEGLYFSSAV